MIRELDCIALTVDLHESGQRRGDIGAVVLIHADGENFEVEFVSESGVTLAVATLKTPQIRKVEVDRSPAEDSGTHVPFHA